MFLGPNEYHGHHQRRSINQTDNTRWPRSFLDDAKKMTDDALLHRGESIARHIRQKIALQHDLLRHQEVPVRTDYNAQKAMYTVFCSTLITASMAEVLSVFSCDAQLGFQAFLARVFGAELVEVKTARRLATGVPTNTGEDDFDNVTVISDVTSHDERDDTKRSVAGAIKHAKFETKRLFSRTRHELVFLDAMQQPSPTSIVRAFKSLDNPQVYRMTDIKGKLIHVSNLLFGYHIEEVKTDRVQIAFYGNHFGQKPSSPCFAYRILHKLAKSLAILSDAVIRRRLAAHITTVDASQLHTNSCTRCVKSMALRKQVICRLCGLNFCQNCSTIERVESAQGTTFDLRVCLVCYEQCKSKYILTNKVLATTSLAAARVSTPVSTQSLPTRRPAPSAQQTHASSRGLSRRQSSRQLRVSMAGKQLVQALKHSKFSTHEELLHRISELSEEGSNQSFCQNDVMELLQSLPEESTTPRNLRHSFMSPRRSSSSEQAKKPVPHANSWSSFSTPRGGDYRNAQSDRFNRLSTASNVTAPPRSASFMQPKSAVMPPTPKGPIRSTSPEKTPQPNLQTHRSSLQLDLPLNASTEAEMLRQNVFLDHDINTVLDGMCEALMDEMECSQVYICCLYRSQCILKAACGDNIPNQIPPTCPLNAAILTAKQALFVSDASVDDRFRTSPRVVGAEGVRFFYGVPLVTSDGIEMGTLSIADTIPRGRMAAKAKDTIARVASEIVALMEQRSRIALL
ncbi:hypothetical protein THRCLA_11241 [Thraustotheca clavata]|uniref:FYVE-type domain-containing protein n=1 Tax=Thraustotheca clavata TaxID=74557 RepID=A0A1V9Y8I8_9STRA|nr:hypothetical protein THRCLA_11241 [Thraustotheca clavata]